MPADLARWARVDKVLTALTERGVSNISQACDYAGVAPSSFYNDMQKPEIIQKIANQLDQVDALAAATVSGRWIEVVDYQLEIAVGRAGAAKDSTPAARFVQTVLQEAKKEIRGEEKQGESEASRVLRRFKDKAKAVKATRTTVIEEVELDVEE